MSRDSLSREMQSESISVAEFARFLRQATGDPAITEHNLTRYVRQPFDTEPKLRGMSQARVKELLEDFQLYRRAKIMGNSQGMGSNTLYLRAGSKSIELAMEEISRLGLTRSKFMALYDSRDTKTIAEHYGWKTNTLYCVLGLLNIPLREGAHPKGEPAPWPELPVKVVAVPAKDDSLVVEHGGMRATAVIRSIEPIASAGENPALRPLRAEKAAIEQQLAELQREIEAKEDRLGRVNNAILAVEALG